MAAGAAMKNVPLDPPARRRPVECPVEAWLAFPRSVAYALSPAGKELVSILDRHELWSRRNDQSDRRS